MTSDIAAMNAAYTMWERRYVYASIAVGFGVLLELLHFGIIYNHKRFTNHRKTLDIFVQIGVIILLVGVALEPIFSSQIQQIEAKRFRTQNDLIDSQRSALTLSINEQRRLSTYVEALVVTVAPRRLDLLGMREAIKPFPNVIAYMMTADDQDALELSKQMQSAYFYAKSTLKSIKGDDFPPTEGISISYSINGSAHSAALALCLELNKQSIDAFINQDFWDINLPEGSLLVRINPRRQAVQTQQLLPHKTPAEEAMVERILSYEREQETSCK